MGLLRQLFKKKAEDLPSENVNQPDDAVKGVEKALESLEIQGTSDEETGRSLLNCSTGVQPGDLHAKIGGASSVAGVLGENPLDAIVDIESTSLESVDYTHEEEAPPFQLNPNPGQQRENVKTTSPAAEQQPVANNDPEEGIPQEQENLQDDSTLNAEPATEQLEEEVLADTDAVAESDGNTSPPPAGADDLSMSFAPLQTVLYLTEDNENMDDTISVVSDGYGPATPAAEGGGGGGGGDSSISGKAAVDLAEGLSELEKALKTMEAEGLVGSPVSTAAVGSLTSGGFDGGSSISASVGMPQSSSIAASGGNKNGITTSNTPYVQKPPSPGGSMSTTSLSVADGARFSSNMVKLYNDLALRLMDAKEYDQALQMLSKAEAILDNDVAWALPSGVLAAAGSSGSLDKSSNNNNEISGELTSGSSLLFDRTLSENFNVGSVQESSFDEAAFKSAASTLASIDGVQSYLDRISAKRKRLRAITYNNIGCLYKRRSVPERALTYLQDALALEEAAGDVHDCASTHLNLCASYSALTRFREALAHAERAIILIQRQLWGPTAASFQDGMMYLGRVMAALAATVAAGSDSTEGDGGGGSKTAATTAAAAAAVAVTYAEAYKRQRKLLASANILAMAYHNAAVEHERLNNLREAQVSYSRACSIGNKFLGPKSSTTVALVHAQKGFVARQQREAGGALQSHHSGGIGGGGGARAHVLTSKSNANTASKARQGGITTKKTPFGGAPSSSRMPKSLSIASKLAQRERR